jgi:hypothetical protein
MTANTKICHVTKFGNVITCQGRMMYPTFFEPSLPKGETDRDKAKYQGTLIFPVGADLKALAQAVEDAAIEKWGPSYKEKHKVRKPFGKAEDQPKMSGTAEEFPVFIRANSKDRPQVVSAAGKPVTEEQSEEVYPGRWARFSVRAYAYDHPTGGKGVSLGLQNVQLLDNDERLAGARPQASDEFSPVEGASEGADTDQLFD